jgi:ferritin-like metal-binding protein YciE
MVKDKTLHDLFYDTLKDIYFAERKILSALPKMAKAAQQPDLKAAFLKHEDETEEQVARLEKVFKIIGEQPRAKTCDAIMGIIDEGKEMMDEYKGTRALDAGLLAVAQAVEHYEISRYGTLKTWAEELGFSDAVQLLDATLTEEKNTDKSLTQLAKTVVNQKAEVLVNVLVNVMMWTNAAPMTSVIVGRSCIAFHQNPPGVHSSASAGRRWEGQTPWDPNVALANGLVGSYDSPPSVRIGQHDVGFS